MKNRYSLIIIALALVIGLNAAQAQKTESVNRLRQYGDVSLAFGEGFLGSLAYQHTWGLGKSQKLRLSYGFRLTGYSGPEREFYSAPIEYYMIEEETDTLTISDPGMSNLALYIGATYRVGTKWEFGFNIDALGYTFGGDRDGVFTGNNGETINATVNPNQVTALLVGANDIGMIKAEFFAAYQFNDRMTLRAGFNNNFIEYKTATELQAGNTRFRADPTAYFVGFRYKL